MRSRGVVTVAALIAGFVLSLALVLPNAGALAQGMRHKEPPAAKKVKDERQKKADDKAYKDALKHIPNANKPVDPWQGVR